MDEKIDLRIIIAGAGRVGIKTAELLSDRGHNIIIIEKDSSRCEKVSNQYIATVINGDASRPSTLGQADLKKSDVIAGLTGRSAVNFTVCEFAKKVNPDIRTIMRIDDTEDIGEFDKYVNSVIYPEDEAAKIAANEIVGSEVRSLGGITGEIEVMSVVIGKDAPVAEKKLKNVNFPAGSLIISDYNGNRIAKPDSVFEPGERIIVAFEPKVSEEVMQLLRG